MLAYRIQVNKSIYLMVKLFYVYVPQAKYKQAREERKMLLTTAHNYMIDILADRLSLEPTAVEEFILDSSSVSFSS